MQRRAAARDMAADMTCTRQGAGVDPLLAARTCRRWAALRKLRFGGVAPTRGEDPKATKNDAPRFFGFAQRTLLAIDPMQNKPNRRCVQRKGVDNIESPKRHAASVAL